VAWLGGGNDEVTRLWQEVTIDAQTPALSYWQWIEVEAIGAGDSCGDDFARVLVNDVEVTADRLCGSTGGWEKRLIDLRAFVGQTVQVTFEVGTDGVAVSSLYLDDVALEAAAFGFRALAPRT
jgi:immune inhibitor InhA-like protein